jgi:hypothetical protein
MADDISLGKRMENDIALDLLKVILARTSEGESSDKILALYQKCRMAMHERLRTN